MSTSISIVTGSPKGAKGASFTRFVLPFGYQPQKWAVGAEQPAGSVFAPLADADRPDVFRRQYLTFETATVLYDRARWLELAPFEPRRFNLWREEQPILVELATPRLVLFEWPKDQAEAESQDAALRTGFLLLDLSFPDPGVTLDDLLFVNDLFRLWLKPFHDHEKTPYPNALREAPRSLGDLQDDRDKHGQPGEKGHKSLPPDVHSYFDRWAYLLEVPCKIDGSLWTISSGKGEALSWAENGTEPSGWAIYSDARTFVWTCAVVEGGATAALETAGAWVRLLNVDGPGSDAPTDFERDWARERTYRRWSHRGSLYGFNTHAGALLAPPGDEPPLCSHWGGPYFDHVLLLLYLRVGLFRYSRWLASVSGKALERLSDGRDGQFEEDLRQIRKSFTLFTNLYQYPLLSNQQQALEMYTLSRKALDLPELFAEVHEQIKTSYEFLDMEANQAETEAARRLNVVAAGVGVVALALGLVGADLLTDGLGPGLGWMGRLRGWGLFAIFVGLGVLGLKLLGPRWKIVEGWLFGSNHDPVRKAKKEPTP